MLLKRHSPCSALPTTCSSVNQDITLVSRIRNIVPKQAYLRCGSQGDITKIEVDAIVNAANRSLLGPSLLVHLTWLPTPCSRRYYDSQGGGGGGLTTRSDLRCYGSLPCSSYQSMLQFIWLPVHSYSLNVGDVIGFLSGWVFYCE